MEHPYKTTLFTHMKGKVMIVWLCLVVQAIVRR
jgi:hypothetical protein